MHSADMHMPSCGYLLEELVHILLRTLKIPYCKTINICKFNINCSKREFQVMQKSLKIVNLQK